MSEFEVMVIEAWAGMVAITVLLWAFMGLIEREIARRGAEQGGRSSRGAPASTRGGSALLVLLMIALLSSCASMRPSKPIHAGFFAAAAGDVISTRNAIGRGAREANPLLGKRPSTIRLAAIKGVSWLGAKGIENWAERSMGRKLHWWERTIIWLGPIAIQAWAWRHNNGVARRQHP